MSDRPLLELTEITKHYGAVQALSGLSLTVNAGEVVALVGDNGAGKSTTVKIIAGSVGHDGGELWFDGQQRHWQSTKEAQQAGIETLYQEMGLAPHLSVSANIFLGRERRMKGVLGRLGFLDDKAMERESRLHLDDLKVEVPGGNYASQALSGGQRQAVVIAKSLTWANKLLLLDEPTNHLGVQGTQQVLKLVREVKNRGLGVLFISHTIPHVLEVSDRIVVLWQGKMGATLDARSTNITEVVKEITGATAAAS